MSGEAAPGNEAAADAWSADSASEPMLQHVPAELGGARADAVVAALHEISRTEAAQWISEGRVLWGQHRSQAGAQHSRAAGAAVKKSDRLPVDALIRVDRPVPEDLLKVEAVEGLKLLHEDGDIVVVDKPTGVAAHPSPGWRGPTVVGAARPGRGDRHFRRAGASRHRPPTRCRNLGGDGGGEDRTCLQRAQGRFPGSYAA